MSKKSEYLEKYVGLALSPQEIARLNPPQPAFIPVLRWIGIVLAVAAIAVLAVLLGASLASGADGSAVAQTQEPPTPTNTQEPTPTVLATPVAPALSSLSLEPASLPPDGGDIVATVTTDVSDLTGIADYYKLRFVRQCGDQAEQLIAEVAFNADATYPLSIPASPAGTCRIGASIITTGGEAIQDGLSPSADLTVIAPPTHARIELVDTTVPWFVILEGAETAEIKLKVVSLNAEGQSVDAPIQLTYTNRVPAAGTEATEQSAPEPTRSEDGSSTFTLSLGTGIYDLTVMNSSGQPLELVESPEYLVVGTFDTISTEGRIDLFDETGVNPMLQIERQISLSEELYAKGMLLDSVAENRRAAVIRLEVLSYDPNTRILIPDSQTDIKGWLFDESVNNADQADVKLVQLNLDLLNSHIVYARPLQPGVEGVPAIYEVWLLVTFETTAQATTGDGTTTTGGSSGGG